MKKCFSKAVKLYFIVVLSFSFYCTIHAQVRKEVKIGTQVWTTTNLDVSNYRNGDPIPHVQDLTKWRALKTGAWCYYENKTSNGTIYGKLYNAFAVHDPRGLAPKGYHIPTAEEWNILYEFLGGDWEAPKKLKKTNGWGDNDNGTNSSGFEGLPGGSFQYIFGGIGEIGQWWSSSKDPEFAEDIYLSYFLRSNENHFNRLGTSGQPGCSVRCIKDAGTNTDLSVGNLNNLQRQGMVFTKPEEAVDYLENNYFLTPGDKNGSYWGSYFYLSFDHDCLSVFKKFTGKIPQQYLQKNKNQYFEKSNTDALMEIVTVDESFEEIRIPWDKITDIKVIKNTQGDYLLHITGAAGYWYVWADKYENIRQALLYLSKNHPTKSEEYIRQENQERAFQERMNALESEFGGVTGAVNYLNNTIHYLFTGDYRVIFSWHPKYFYFAITKWDYRNSEEGDIVFQHTFKFRDKDVTLFFSNANDDLDFVIMPDHTKGVKYVSPFFIDEHDREDVLNDQYQLKLWKRGWSYDESIKKAERAIEYLRYKAENE